jgi:hypothetical protein
METGVSREPLKESMPLPLLFVDKDQKPKKFLFDSIIYEGSRYEG